MKSNSQVAENRFLGTISTSSLRNLLPRSISGKHKSNSILRKTKSDAENTPPVDSNIQIERSEAGSELSKSPRPHIAVSDPQIELQEEVSVGINGQCDDALRSDSPVKVVVRVRPSNEREKGGDWLVTKVSSESLCVGDRNFCFDSILDSKSNQEDVFQLVGVPLVKNALAGYNNTILSYGQSGSGKTYTMWGPPSAIVEGPSPSSHQGIVPRIFQMLFSEIQKEEDHVDGKQINYQCRCSFLEIYNEQIGDLLDPSQRNLEIKDDPKNGLYVENLTEEYVTSYEDITQILIKGLSSRKVGATSVNSKSSRSHIVFTCIVESWCKGSSSKCFSSSKTSKISLVDLAGLDKNRRDDLGRQELIEGKKVKKSLSKLGHLVDALAKGSQSGTHNDVLYRGSCLTHLLRESLGGNSKLTVICAISPDNKCSAEMMRTLRFGQRVKSIKNEPVINEINEDDVNDLSDQIRQLKEELIRAKSNENSLIGNKFGYLNGQNVRDSLNQLRVSLNRSLILPRIGNDSEEEVNVDMHDVRELCQQLDKLHGSHEEGKSGRLSDQRDSIEYFSVDESSEADVMSEDDDIHFPEETEMEEINLDVPTNATSIEPPLRSSLSISISEAIKHPLRSSLSISTCLRSSVLQEPTLSESPKIGNIQRRSMAMSSSFLASENMSRSSNLKPDVLRQSPRQSEIRSSLHSSKIFPGPTESLAASLQRGLQIIDYHQQNSPSSRSSMAFSFEHLTLKPCPEVDKADASVQTSSVERSSTDFLCASCQQKISSNDSNEVQNGSEAWTLTVDEVPKSQDGGNVLAEAKKREQELENICKEQASKIEQLNHLVEQYKHGQASTLLCLEASKNEISSEEQMFQGGGYDVENHQPEIIKEVREELDREYSDTAFDKNEKEALLTEIQSLKRKLQSYTEASPNKSIDEKLRSSSLLLQSINLRRSLRPQDNSKEELEMERQRWTEMESDWISLTDELRVDLESIRQRAEKVEMELRLEKKCTEELDDALNRSILGHARMIEHYADLQDKYDDLLGKHRAIMEGIAEVKRAAAKAGKKGYGPRAAKALAAELSALRVERERERDFLKKENKSLRIQLRDTAEAVHAAGELLVRLREAEQVAAVAEENYANAQQENEKLRKQMEKLKRKHKMEAITMKQYLAESKLPESALRPLYREDSDVTSHANTSPHCEDDQAWRAEFGAIYQEHY